MITKILLATDGSDTALQAAEAAAALSVKFDAPLTILNVFDLALTSMNYGEIPTLLWEPSYINELQDDALGSALRTVRVRGIDGVPRKETGPPASEILRVAREEKSDLIVLGSHGRSAIQSFFLGSVSDRVAHQAACPVLIIRPKEQVADQPCTFTQILLAVDGSDHAHRAAQSAAELARSCGSALTVLHVNEPVSASRNLVIKHRSQEIMDAAHAAILREAGRLIDIQNVAYTTLRGAGHRTACGRRRQAVAARHDHVLQAVHQSDSPILRFRHRICRSAEVAGRR